MILQLIHGGHHFCLGDELLHFLLRALSPVEEHDFRYIGISHDQGPVDDGSVAGRHLKNQ